MVDTITNPPPASTRRRGPRPAAGLGTPARALVRRYRLAPYLLLLPSIVAIALVLLWPVIQVTLYSFQNYGLPQTDGAAPVQWIGLANFTATFADPEFWLSLRITVLFAVAAVDRSRCWPARWSACCCTSSARRWPAFVGTAALLAWATPPVSASVLFYWLFNPDGGLVDWTLSRMPHWLVGSTDWAGLQLDHQRRAARLHGADAAGGVAVVPVHRGVGAGRAEDGARRAATRRPGRRRHRLARLLEDHLPAAEADLPGPAAAVGDLGLQRLHPDLHADRRPG